MIKNAIAYVSRKKKRTLIIFIILTLVLSCLYSCLVISKASNSLEKSLYKSSNSSLSITKKDGGYFSLQRFESAGKMTGTETTVYTYEATAKLTNTKAVLGEQRVKMEYLSDELKNIAAVEATNNIEKNSLFSSGVFTLKEGRKLKADDRNKIMVHEEFVKKNNLKLHDKVGIEFFDADKSTLNREHQFEIIGIFSGKKQETYTGLSSDFSENMMFVDYESAQEAMQLKGENKLVSKISLFAESPEKLEKAEAEAKVMAGTDDEFDISKDNNAYRDVLESVAGVKHIIKIMTYLIMTGGIIVLSLILILWLRERIYEIGILLSVGISKIKIVLQFIFELVLVSLPAVIASLVFGNLISNRLLRGFSESASGGIAFGNLLGTRDFAGNAIAFLQSYGILLSIIVVSVVFASIMILIKSPKEILSKIS